MGTTIIPDLIDALVANATTAMPNVAVYDGFEVNADPSEQYLMVGVDDPDAENEAAGAHAQQEWANANHTARDETGSIICAAMGFDGGGDAKTARDSAFAVVTAVENMLRTTPAQGVTGLLWTSFGGRIKLMQNQTDNGAIALVLFDIDYRARI